ncbi:hypothetical protein GCM10007103_34300 [Salinimicrobium marinum]|uniref:Outer membrane protein beta-barrel domain-containing protein n=1 Tax=Salinimicrobium marinum TaxID=680283 RepID=A0A918SLS4_9FLAO|nr:DUF6048 family protein [Salinimicrobium marinum]GHA50631.1 hypothetical protein GCM10007103_34300 [Salinimicrobium marinum]
MKLKQHIFILFISLVFLQAPYIFAQQEQAVSQEDSLDFREKYGLRVGIDLAKPLRTLLDDDYRGLELNGDYRVYENYYLAAELGNEKDQIIEENITANGSGSYIKLGIDYNAYRNWQGMQNSIYVGIRYAFASFSTELEEYSIYTRNPYFERDTRIEGQEYNNLTANWVEMQLGIKVEVLNNLYLGAHVQLKRMIGQATPGNFDNLYVPGFNRTYDGSSIGVGYGYAISYLIPLYKL